MPIGWLFLTFLCLVFVGVYRWWCRWWWISCFHTVLVGWFQEREISPGRPAADGNKGGGAERDKVHVAPGTHAITQNAGSRQASTRTAVSWSSDFGPETRGSWDRVTSCRLDAPPILAQPILAPPILAQPILAQPYRDMRGKLGPCVLLAGTLEHSLAMGEKIVQAKFCTKFTNICD